MASGYVFRNHPTMIQDWKNLCDAHPTVANSITAQALGAPHNGKTYNGNDIWIFRIGNPNGGRLLLDATTHGWEDICAEYYFSFVEWLLTSGDAKAQQILNENYLIIIPTKNYDVYSRGNANTTSCPEGVDLNRNHIWGWSNQYSGPGNCDPTYNASNGDYAGSEPETQIMRFLMNLYKPTGGNRAIYINGHYGGGPYIYYQQTNDTEHQTWWNSARAGVLQYWDANNILLKNVYANPSNPTQESARANFIPVAPQGVAGNGNCYGDAAHEYGYEAFLWEGCGRHCYTGSEGPLYETGMGWGPASQIPCSNPNYFPTDGSYENLLYPHAHYIILALCESVAIPYVPPNPGTVDDTEIITIYIQGQSQFEKFLTGGYINSGVGLIIAENSINATGINQDYAGYVLKDFGANHFSNTTIQFKTRVTQAGYTRTGCFALMNETTYGHETLQDGINGNMGIFVYWLRTEASPNLVLRDCTPTGTDSIATSINMFPLNAYVNCILQRTGPTTTLDIYSATGTFIERLTTTGIDSRAYQYLLPFCGSGSGTSTGTMDLDVADYLIS